MAPTEVAVSQPRGLVFFVSGLQLYALTARGGLTWGVELSAPLASNVAIDAGGAAWLLTEDDKLHRILTPYFHDIWQLAPVAEAAAAPPRGKRPCPG